MATSMAISRWKKARKALGLHVCVSASSADNLKHAMASDHEALPPPSSSITPSVNAVVSPRFSSKLLSSLHISTPRSTCAICLEVMKAGHGQALFTAECSHSFHFSCIASNVRYGNLICPVCRATWKEVPWQAPSPKLTDKKSGVGNVQRRGSSMSPRQPRAPAPAPTPDQQLQMMRRAEEEQRRLEPVLRMLDESIANYRSDSAREKQLTESDLLRFDDDEPLESAGGKHVAANPVTLPSTQAGCRQAMQITALPEETDVLFSESRDNLTILVHVKGAAVPDAEQQLANMLGSSACTEAQRRAAVDLVAVLDISGSMAGSKLALMKRAMRLVVRSLGPADRLSIVAFASKAWRVIPLRRMTEEGRRSALEALDTLTCTGGTSIAEGLRKGTAVLQQRRQRNPIATIMLLSDGQDSYTMRQASTPIDASVIEPVLPASADAQQVQVQSQIPVHTFGLGVDHDASAMHTISEESGGTFSFIQGEGLVQDAFAQCLGGLLSVVALRVEIEVGIPNRAISELISVEAGSYKCETIVAGCQARVRLGDLYAHEERDLLVNLKLPPLRCPEEGEALCVFARYCDPVSGTCFRTSATRVFIRRPSCVPAAVRPPCIEVDRHRNRLHAAHAIVEARALADRGKLLNAQQLLDKSRRHLQSSVAFRNGDKLSEALDAELARIQTSMGNVRTYQTCGRAYALSAQSSHMQQRATMRGEEGVSEGYRTPCMDTMLVHAGSLQTVAPPPPPAGQPTPPSPRRRHIVEPRPGSRLARLASFDSVIRP